MNPLLLFTGAGRTAASCFDLVAVEVIRIGHPHLAFLKAVDPTVIQVELRGIDLGDPVAPDEDVVD